MSILTIAICDDDAEFLNNLGHKVKAICSEQGVVPRIHLCNESQQLLTLLDDGVEIDLFFLDIEMPGMTGIQLGHLFREEYKLLEPLIIVVSSHSKYHDELHPLHIFDFFRKPVDTGALQKTLSRALEFLLSVNLYTFLADRIPKGVNKRHILYLESAGRRLEIVYKTREGYVAAKRLELPIAPYREAVERHFPALAQEDAVVMADLASYISHASGKILKDMQRHFLFSATFLRHST